MRAVHWVVAWGVVSMCGAFVGLAFVIPSPMEDLWPLYDKSRGSLFTGFFTLSSFLLSMKTMILFRMKSDVYDRQEYQRLISVLQKRTPSLRHYGPLAELSSLIFLSISSSLIASLAQLTIGLYESKWTMSLSLSIAVFAFYFVSRTVLELRGNIKTWFQVIEEEARKGQ